MCQDSSEFSRQDAREKPKTHEIAFRAGAKKWAEVENLRRFRAACEARLKLGRADGRLFPGEQAWIAWADQLIEDLDPLRDYFLDVPTDE